ncbi:DUF4838 domain-containing protein [Maribacter sp. 2307ULW6-5]|uniref:DUF4838 domain-containing protein n=1 Tax=Maribacter sp. 2307ULW6-5 TaxID=3386275 RepID=UPI0039BD758D
MRTIRFLICMSLLAVMASCADPGVALTQNGASSHVILLKADASASDRESANTLQHYVQAISGAQLPIVSAPKAPNGPYVYLNTLTGDSVKPETVHLRTDGDDLYILGGSDEALQHAVFTFLEESLGCKWYAPNAEVVPQRPNIFLDPMDHQYTPPITTRTVHSRLFYENEAFAARHKVTTEAFPRYVPQARVHTFHRFMPEAVFYASHPEYYALRGEQRLPTQLCLTHPEVLRIVTDSVAAMFKRHPLASVISVSQDDNQQYCQCENCNALNTQAGSPAGSMIAFVNQVAKQFPDKTISALAYQHTRKPPKTKPLENVLITLCSIECDRSAPIAQNCADFASDLRGWSELTDNIRIWDYTTQFTNFLAPFPNLHTLRPNMALFHRNGANWVFAQHSNHPSELFELRSYITAKLLWNPSENLENLITEFTDGYYEAAGPYVKEYIDVIHEEIGKDADFFLFLYGDPSEAFDSYLRPELLKKYTQLFDDAEAAVAGNPELRNRVRLARMGVDYAVLEASRKNLTPQLSLVTMDAQGKPTTNTTTRALLERFTNLAGENNITLMNEMGFTVTEYKKNYATAMETAKRSNKAKGKNVVSLTAPKKYANEDPLVLTDGALGGNSFYANWLGYEGHDMEVVVDLESAQPLHSLSTAFLQVTNHVVFFPSSVLYYGSNDNQSFALLGQVANPQPLGKDSKVNDIHYFNLSLNGSEYRYVKLVAKNTQTPYWHHAAGLPSWIFADEIIVD